MAQILADPGLDVSKQFPEPLTDEAVRAVVGDIDQRARALLVELIGDGRGAPAGP